MLGLQTFIGANYAQEWGAFAAGAVLGAIPMVTIYLLLQAYIVGGAKPPGGKGKASIPSCH